MDNIIDYKILTQNNHQKLTGEVMEFINKGYVPLGGICFTISPNGVQHHYS